MGLPDSGHGSSFRRTSSELASKGIRKSSRKNAHPSSALKRLQFGEDLPPMAPSSAEVSIPLSSDPSISPSKGNVARLVQDFEEGQIASSITINAHCQSTLIDNPISIETVSDNPEKVLAEIKSKKPHFVFGHEQSNVDAPVVSDFTARDLEVNVRDDLDIDKLTPTFEDVKTVVIEGSIGCAANPSLAASCLNNNLSSTLTTSVPSNSVSLYNSSIPQCSTSSPISLDQAALLDLVKAQPLATLPPIFIPVSFKSQVSTLLPSSQMQVINPIFDVPTPNLTQNLPQIANVPDFSSPAEGISLMETSDFSPLLTNQATMVPPIPDIKNCWGAEQQTTSLEHGTCDKHSESISNAKAPTIAQLFKGPSSTGGPVSFDHLSLKDIGSVEFCEVKPLLKFSHSDTSFLAGQLGFALVGKFSHSIPSPFSINKALGNIKLTGTLTWKFLNTNHILIKLSDSCDYVKLLNGVSELPMWFINGCPMRIFIWTPTFHPSKESPVVAVWCKLPGLPVHLYDHSALFKIGSLIGRPLQIDFATAHCERASFARICVEIDITKHVPDVILLEINSMIFNQRVVYENLPKFCIDCNHVGHSIETCYAKGKNPRPAKRMDFQKVTGKQQVGSHVQAGKSGNIEGSSDGFQKVVYRKKNSGNMMDIKQGVGVQNAGGTSNRFTHLAEDMDTMDTSESAIQEPIQDDNKGRNQLILEQSHVGINLQRSASGQKQQGEDARNVGDASEKVVSFPDDKVSSEHAVQMQYFGGRSPRKTTELDHLQTENRQQNSKLFLNSQQVGKAANNLLGESGNGKDNDKQHTSAVVRSGEIIDDMDILEHATTAQFLYGKDWKDQVRKNFQETSRGKCKENTGKSADDMVRLSDVDTEMSCSLPLITSEQDFSESAALGNAQPRCATIHPAMTTTLGESSGKSEGLYDPLATS